MSSKFWNKQISSAKAYVPGEQPRDKQYIKLNTNELPYPPSPAVQAVLKDFDSSDLRLYPDPSQKKLRTAIADYFGLDSSEIFVGNGSDEILAFCFQAFFEAADTSETAQVLSTELGYSFYPVYADFFKVALHLLPLNTDLTVDPDAFKRPSRAVLLANPNAPTGLFLDNDAIRRLLEQDLNRLVIIDEAYVDFAPESAASLVNEFDNLLVVQTFSKSRALAGLRLGFALGKSPLIRGLEIVRDNINSYTVDRLSESLGIAAISDAKYFSDCCAGVVRTRERVIAALKNFGAELTDSQANFIWVKHPDLGGAEVYQKLKSQGILVRYFKDERIAGRVRVSMGTDAEMDQFLDAFMRLKNA